MNEVLSRLLSYLILDPHTHVPIHLYSLPGYISANSIRLIFHCQANAVWAIKKGIINVSSPAIPHCKDRPCHSAKH